MISVIIPCYNVEQYITPCIESILSQTVGLDSLEIILIDDCSTDGTLNILKQFEQRYPDNIILIPFESNQKQGTARNVGLQYASGEYVSFVDSDDWIEPDMYQTLLHEIQSDEYDYICFRSYRNPADGPCTKIPPAITAGIYTNIPSTADGGEWFNFPHECGVCGKLYRRSFLSDNEFVFPEKLLYEDNYFVAVAALYTHKTKVIDKYFYHYRENKSSTTMGKNNYSQFDRLTIEELKLTKYKELGLFDRFHDHIEKAFFRLYYFNTLFLMATRFDEPSLGIFLDMKETINHYFPDFKEDKNLIVGNNPLYDVLLRILDTPFDDESFNAFMKKYRSLSQNN